jgi:hypothetical protein
MKNIAFTPGAPVLQQAKIAVQNSSRPWMRASKAMHCSAFLMR